MGKRRDRKQALGGEGLRLLQALARGRVAMTALEAAAVVLVETTSRGVSLAGARFPAAAAEQLVARGLAAWTGTSDGRRLRLEDAGRAFLARGAAPAEMAFIAQHSALEEVDIEDPGGGTVAVLRDLAESPLAWLRRRRDSRGRPLIGEAAFAAGERLRAELTLAGTLPSVTANWSAVGRAPMGPAGGQLLIQDAALAARQRVDAAMRAVGADLGGLLVDVCGFLKGLEEVERERCWPPRSAKVVLGIALARLADHYGYADEARGPDRSGRLRVWATAPE